MGERAERVGLEWNCDDCVYIVKFVAKGNIITSSPSYEIATM